MSCTRSFWCLHGNLGLPSDWQGVLEAWARQRGVAWSQRLVSHGEQIAQIGSEHFTCVDLWSDEVAGSPERWAEAFTGRVVGKPTEGKRILIGYSLGGRLAMEAIVKAPQAWSAVVLVSNHAGGLSQDERTQRQRIDEEWARLFEDPSLPWDDLMECWNDQLVFRSTRTRGVCASRREGEFTRAKLAAAFRRWSLANMSVSLVDVASTLVPTLWVVGRDDDRMMRQCEALRGRLGATVQPIILEGGHRLLQEDPRGLAKAVEQFLQ